MSRLPRPLRSLPFLALAAAVFALCLRPEREVGADFPLPLGEDAAQAAAPLPLLAFERRTDILQGRLLTADGAPLDSALIFAEAGRRPAWCRSAANGDYRLTELLAPPWELTIIAPGHENRRLTVEDAAAGAVLHPGAPLPEPAELPAASLAPLRGRVLPAAPGDDLDGYELALLPTAAADTFGAPFALRWPLESDGAFELPELQAGAYRILVLPPWARGGSWPDLTQPLDSAPRTIEHPHAAEEDLILPIAAGEIRGRILGSEQGQLAGAMVTVRRDNPEQQTEPARVVPTRHWPPVATEADGSFRIRDLPAGTYRIELRAGAGSEEQVVAVRERAVLTVDFDPVSIR
ncbi:MAG: hypothetical protein CMK00_07865 [Planctomycetes bacterium]|jgi:hypothetical protein|nr:hypothetical protein [Planctomycetota bacterium]HJO25728.1 carboxypeptidase-like regulatory domain-containing protein [Planctomycetota bacterium]